MNDDQMPPVNSEPASPAFDPHAESLSKRDWNFLLYMAALGVLPLIAAVILCLVLWLYFPQFENF